MNCSRQVGRCYVQKMVSVDCNTDAMPPIVLACMRPGSLFNYGLVFAYDLTFKMENMQLGCIYCWDFSQILHVRRVRWEMGSKWGNPYIRPLYPASSVFPTNDRAGRISFITKYFFRCSYEGLHMGRQHCWLFSICLDNHFIVVANAIYWPPSDAGNTR